VDSYLQVQTDLDAKNRIQDILVHSAQWIAIRDIKELLESLAKSAISLFEADRASIFLADKKTHQLVGYPAIGISNGLLKVPDNAGIVGAVYQTLQPKRWDREDPIDEVNRSVDQVSGYRTNSLLAVPMVDHRNRPLGVFELINARMGSFSPLDEILLMHLASIAAAAISTTQRAQHLLSGRNSVVNSQLKTYDHIGSGPFAVKLKEEIAAIAVTDLPVLLIGENGTGKEVAAHAIHAASQRGNQPFIAVNCAAITETLLESELFGHERGAFTDAHEARIGKFELASGGTLLLDEIGDMSLAGQAKLLRVLEERNVVKVGGTESISVNVRVIAATNQDLPNLISLGRFREDLYYRLNVVPIDIPPLRARVEDIEELSGHFLQSFAQELQRPVKKLSDAALEKLRTHPWPGNIRELRNVLLRATALNSELVIESEHIRFVASARAVQQNETTDYSNKTLADATNEFQAMVIEQHIDAADKNMTQAAETLGLQRSNLYRKMKQLGMKQQ
jgi:Nif-specific regulatory protein